MKRKVKRQLKENELVSTITRIIEFSKKKSRQLITLGVLIIAVVIVFIGIKIVEAHKRTNESRVLDQVLRLSSQMSDNPEKINELEKVAGNGKFSRLAYVQLASHWYEKGELEKAHTCLEKIPENRKDFIYYQSKNLLAQVCIRQKKYDRALEICQRIEEENPAEYSMDAILFKKAQALKEKGEKDKALEVYRKIQEDYPQTYYGYDASQEIKQMEREK